MTFSSVFFRKTSFLSLILSFIALENSFFAKDIWLALTNFFLVRAKLLYVSMLILQNLLNPSSFFTISDWKDYVLEIFKFSVGKLFKWPIINDSRPLFLTIFLIIVNVIKGKSDNPVWITQEIWSVRGTLVKFRSMHVAQKMKFSIEGFSVNVTKSAGNCGFDQIYWRNPSWKTSFFV